MKAIRKIILLCAAVLVMSAFAGCSFNGDMKDTSETFVVITEVKDVLSAKEARK